MIKPSGYNLCVFFSGSRVLSVFFSTSFSLSYELDFSSPHMLIETKDTNWTIPSNKETSDIIKQFLGTNLSSNALNLVTDLDYFVQALQNYVEFDSVIENTTDFEKHIRENIKMSFRLNKDAYEGEVTDIRKYEDYIELDLMSSKETITMKLPKRNEDEIDYIRIGDIIYVEPSLGAIKKLGRSENKAGELDLEGTKYVPIPKGKVYTQRQKEIVVTLAEIDHGYGSMERAEDFVRQSLIEGVPLESQPVMSINTIILINTPLGNKERRILFKYATEYSGIKFIVINEPTKCFMTVRLSSENLMEIMKAFSVENGFDKIFSINETTELIGNVLTRDNFSRMLSIVKMSSDLGDLKKNLTMFKV